MTEHTLRDRRKLAAPYATAAWRSGDVHDRASLTSVAKRCYNADAAEPKGGLREVWDVSFYDHVIQKKIGQQLREEYSVQKELPHRFLTLLMQLNPLQDALSAHGDEGGPTNRAAKPKT